MIGSGFNSYGLDVSCETNIRSRNPASGALVGFAPPLGPARSSKTS